MRASTAACAILFLIIPVSSAPSAHSHAVAYRRRERFIHRHARSVHASTGYDPILHAPFNVAPPPSNSGEAPSSQTHDPYIRAKVAPTQGAKSNSSSAVDYSGNWCGMVQNLASGNTSSPFVTVNATWTMPTLFLPNLTDSSTSPDTAAGTMFYGSQWVGIDGYTYGGAILQAGTTSTLTVLPDGTLQNTASAWFEWFPLPESEISASDFPVSPGDQISVTVHAYNSSVGTVTMENANTGITVNRDFAAPNSDASLEGVNAEWIYEDFSSGGLVPFAGFSPVVFENCSAETQTGESVGVQGATSVSLVSGNDVLCNAKALGDDQMVVSYGASVADGF